MKKVLKSNISFGTILQALCLALLINRFFLFSIVSGHSMEPTLHDGDYCICTRTINIEYGDIIVFESPTLQEVLIKRVIGKPGDVITIKEGHVYRNNVLLTEEYIHDDMSSSDIQHYVVPSNSYFVCGDNRNNSLDSRSYLVGFVSKDDILGVYLKTLHKGVIHNEEESEGD